MERLIIIFSLGLMFLFITLYILLSKEVKSISEQLNKINNIKTNAKIMIGFKNKKIENLALEINKTLEKKNSIETEYKKMDSELRVAIANMSHDLRTPLTSIIGYIQLIEDDTLSKNERKKCMDVVKKRAKSLQNLIANFYDLSRLQAKEYKLELKSLNLKNILCDILASFYNDFLNKGIEPIIEIDERVTSIIGDESSIRRVLSNLIQNMLKYGKKNIFISLKKQENFILIVFKNDAPDLTDEDASHLFERFFTVDRTRNGNSTGLGLAIAKELILKMGEEIYSQFYEGKLSIIIKFRCGQTYL